MRPTIRAGLLMISIVTCVAFGAFCEPWCSHPCGELNGDVQSECGECDASKACWPGANGFDEPPASRRLVVDAGGAVQAEGAYGSHGNPIQSPDGYFETPRGTYSLTYLLRLVKR